MGWTNAVLRTLFLIMGGLAVVLGGAALLPLGVARGAAPNPRVFLPYVANGPSSPGGPVATPAVAPASTPAPSGMMLAPIVFTSRQILPNGSQYLSSSMAMAGVGSHSRFRVAGPGKLEILNPDSSLKVLVDGSNPTSATLNLIDVSAPSVSYDGFKILFAGAPVGAKDVGPDVEPGVWRIYEINADGTNLHQITFDRAPLDCRQFGGEASTCDTYDDTDPAWLPDGRIVFTSTRWPESAEYSGARSSNLWVVNADGSNLHRITSEKNGADRPLVDPLTGKIVYSRWWRNNHFAVDNPSTIFFNGTDASQGYKQFNGLTIDPKTESGGDMNLNPNFWQEASINPDGTNLQAWRSSYRDQGDNFVYGGAFTPSGTLIGNFFPMFNMTEAAGFGGLRLLTRGFAYATPIIGVTRLETTLVAPGSAGVFPGPYAADPDVFSDGRLVFSMAPDINQDYGLYMANQDGSNLTLLYDHPGTAETAARVIQARPVPPIIPDTVTAVAPALPPPPGGPYNTGGTFTFQDLNVYFNAPVDAPIVSAPAVGSASTVRFFINQQATGIASQPQTDWPTLLGTGPVNADGSLINTSAPADVPLFEQLHEADGVTVPLTYQPGDQISGAAHVAGLNFGRPGSTVQCVGCHAGHSLIPIPKNPQFTNLAPGAQVTVSSTSDANSNFGLIDRQVMSGYLGQYWRSAPGQATGQWVQLTFPVPITVQSVVLYNPRQENTGILDQCNIQVQGTTVQLFADANATQLLASQSTGPLTVMPGTSVPFNNVVARSVRINIGSVTGTFNEKAVASLAEVEVIGSGQTSPPP